MQDMVKPEVESGAILPRSDDEIATAIRSYTLAYEGDELIDMLKFLKFIVKN